VSALRIGAVAAAVVASVLVIAAPAEAHDYLVDSTPTSGSTLTALPDQFSVTANTRLNDLSGDGAGFALEVRDGAGLFYGDGCISITGSTLAMDASLGRAGGYTLLWQLVSEDGHSVSGEIPFTWQPPADFTPSAGQEAAPTCGGEALAAPGESVAPRVVNLADVLWIGGAILAVVVAALVTILVVSRRSKRP
jgi:methionine-rich copper-binding protein CopC